MKVLKKTSWQFPSDLKALDQVLLSFDQLNEPFIPTIVWLQCQLALAEAFTNAVRHAHKDSNSSDLYVEIEVTLLSNAIEIRIWDFGELFDLEGRLQTLQETVSPHTEGGRGLAILQKIADVLSYTRIEDNRNCLLIGKYYSDDSAVEY